mgnify:CR=1 FL=1
MRKLRTFAISMVVAAVGLLVYCGSFYIRSYEQNLAAKRDYEEIFQIAKMQSILFRKEKEQHKKARKKTTGIILKIGNRAIRNITAMQIRSGNPLGFPGKI